MTFVLEGRVLEVSPGCFEADCRAHRLVGPARSVGPTETNRCSSFAEGVEWLKERARVRGFSELEILPSEESRRLPLLLQRFQIASATGPTASDRP